MADPGAALDLRDRDALFDALEARVFDLAVIGGGITGAGVARDAAMRGLSVVLVEARDFATGTSSRSSKMIHGGLRYLAQGDLALVREAASERKIVQAIAPHLARQTPFVIPARTAGAMAKLRAGLWTFEKLGGVPKSRRHEVWSRADLEDREPAIAADDLAGAVVYPEYLTDDARLTLANVRSAAAHGALVVNYAAARAIVKGGRSRERPRGRRHPPGRGRAARAAPRPRDRQRRRPVGRHRPCHGGGGRAAAPHPHARYPSVVPRERLPIERTVILTAADRRGVFAVPKGAMAYLGTTDTFEAHPSPWPAIEAADADYLLAAAAARFSTPPLTRADVVSAWSGVRPLVGEEGKKASDISRRDELWTGPAGVLSIAGGKLTAYRRMAERVVDHVQDARGQKRQASRTADEPLVGGEGAPETLRAALLADGMGAGDTDRLIGLYGAEAPVIVAAGGGPAAEAAHAVRMEGALTLEDYWVRRSARAWFDPDGGLGALPAAAEAMAPLLGWSEARKAEEVAGCRRRHGAVTAALLAD